MLISWDFSIPDLPNKNDGVKSEERGSRCNLLNPYYTWVSEGLLRLYVYYTYFLKIRIFYYSSDYFFLNLQKTDVVDVEA